MLLVFAVVVACVSLLIYRLLLAGLLAAILSMVSLVTLWSVLSMSATVAEGTIPEAGSTPAPLQDLGLLIIGSDATDPTEGDVDEAAPPSTDMHELLPAAARQAEMIRRELATRLEHLRGAWKELDATRQLVIVGSVLGGMLLGLIIATFAPRTTAVIVTAVLGSLLMLGSISRLLSMAGAPMHDLIEAGSCCPPWRGSPWPSPGPSCSACSAAARRLRARTHPDHRTRAWPPHPPCRRQRHIGFVLNARQKDREDHHGGGNPDGGKAWPGNCNAIDRLASLMGSDISGSPTSRR